MLDDVPDEVWRADDVLGWVYEYYNTAKPEEVRKKPINRVWTRTISPLRINSIRHIGWFGCC